MRSTWRKVELSDLSQPRPFNQLTASPDSEKQHFVHRDTVSQCESQGLNWGLLTMEPMVVGTVLSFLSCRVTEPKTRESAWIWMEAHFSQSRRAIELIVANSCLGQNHVLPPQVISGTHNRTCQKFEEESFCWPLACCWFQALGGGVTQPAGEMVRAWISLLVEQGPCATLIRQHSATCLYCLGPCGVWRSRVPQEPGGWEGTALRPTSPCKLAPVFREAY